MSFYSKLQGKISCGPLCLNQIETWSWRSLDEDLSPTTTIQTWARTWDETDNYSKKERHRYQDNSLREGLSIKNMIILIMEKSKGLRYLIRPCWENYSQINMRVIYESICLQFTAGDGNPASHCFNTHNFDWKFRSWLE